MIGSIYRLRRLWRIFKGRCPHCGTDLTWVNRQEHLWTKMCPDLHYGIESHGEGKIVIYDNEGDPVHLLFAQDFRIIKDEESE